MPRPPRVQFEGACYHIFHRGNRRERIYWNDADYAQFEGIMIEAMNWSGVRLFNWSLMPNHFHFLLETPEGNIAEFMQRLLTRYAKYFNWVHKKIGHVFQGRYQAKVCEKENYFMELVRYVELNPYRLKKGRLARLGEWKWSSYRYYKGKQEIPEGLAQAMNDVLGRFGNDLKAARRNLAAFLADGLENGATEDFDSLKSSRFLGSEAFVERVKRRMHEPVRQKARLWIKLESVIELGKKTTDCFGIRLEDLAREGKERSLSRIRQAVVEVGRKQYRFSVKDLAQALGRSEPAISQILRRRWENGEHSKETKQLQAFLESGTKASEC